MRLAFREEQTTVFAERSDEHRPERDGRQRNAANAVQANCTPSP